MVLSADFFIKSLNFLDRESWYFFEMLSCPGAMPFVFNQKFAHYGALSGKSSSLSRIIP